MAKDTAEKIKEAADTIADDAKSAASQASKIMGAVVEDVTELLDSAVETAGKAINTEKGSKVAGGAAVGALAAVVLPFSLVGGAVIGAGYALFRGRKKSS